MLNGSDFSKPFTYGRKNLKTENSEKISISGKQIHIQVPNNSLLQKHFKIKIKTSNST